MKLLRFNQSPVEFKAEDLHSIDVSSNGIMNVCLQQNGDISMYYGYYIKKSKEIFLLKQ